MSLAGSLRTMAIDDLLRWVAARRKTGALVFEAPDDSTTLFLQEGRIISSASTHPRHYFGQFLLAQTALTEEQLRRAFERQERSRVYVGHNIFIKTLLGKILVEEGLLGEAEVARVLHHKIEESIYEVFLWEEGWFRLEPGELPPEELVPVKLDIARVLRNGRERVVRWQEIHARIPSAGARFEVHPEAIPADARIGLAQARILLLLGEGRSFRELVLELRSTDYEVGEALLTFLERGWLSMIAELVPPPGSEAAAEPPAPGPLELGLDLFDQRAYADTLIAARRALRENPANSEARRQVERSERELSESFYARLFGPDDIPSPARAGGAATLASLTPEERFLLERVNGTWPIRSLIQLSPLRELDALAVFKRLFDQGLITVERRPRRREGPPGD